MVDDDREHFGALVGEFRSALAFLSRIPAPALGGATDRRLDGPAARMFPLAGATIGALGGLVLVVSSAVGVPALVAAGLAVAASVAVTGALHEDGLSDTADGFGGGATADQKLDIMKDSRIGAFGALAVTLSVMLRVVALASLLPAGGLRAALALLAAEAASRGAMVKLWHDLPPARPGGIADRLGQPSHQDAVTAVAASAVIVAIAIVPAFGLWAAFVAAAATIAADVACERLFLGQIGGQTGDTLGACQQFTAVALLVAITPFA